MRSTARAVIAGLIVVLLGTVADADPRWWTNDRSIASTVADKTNPDVAVTSGQGALANGAYFVVWEQPGPDGLDIWITATFDGGCTWCDPRVWADEIAPETNPRVEVVTVGANQVYLHVLYEREARIWSAVGSLVLDNLPPCRSFLTMTKPVPSALSRAINPGEDDLRPRLARATDSSTTQVHAAWYRLGGLGATVEYARDLSGTGAWTPAIDLSSLIGRSGLRPAIAADALSSDVTSVTVFFEEPAVTPVVIVTRSADNGTTWSTPGPADIVSGSVVPTGLAADSSTDSLSGFDFSVWNAALWQSAAAPTDVTFDGASYNGPLVRSLEFESPGDVPASDSPDTPGVDPALSIGPGGGPAGGGAAPMFGFWTDDAADPDELVFRPGTLDEFAATPRDLDQHPFFAFRTAPPDPTVSFVEPFSNCLWQDDWPNFAAPSCDRVPRGAPGAGAQHIAAEEYGSFGALNSATFVTVFSDDRDGTSQIYFKRTDSQVGLPFFEGVGLTCSALRTAEGEAFILPPVAECPTTAPNMEFMARQLLYYGSAASEGASPSGPFINRVELAKDAMMGTVPNLKAGELYHFALIPEDEARNINPVGFDPRLNTNNLNVDQQRDATTPSCEPDVQIEACSLTSAYCSPGDPAGNPHPGGTVEATVVLINTGDWAATGITGIIEVTNATVAQPVGGDLSTLGLNIAPFGGVEPIAIVLRIDANCPAGDPTIAITLRDLESDTGQVDYGDPMCDPPIGQVDCTEMCDAPACDTATLAAPSPLYGVRFDATTAEFSWPADPNAAEYHLNSVTQKCDIPVAPVAPCTSGSKLAPVGAAVGECSVAAPGLVCQDPDAFPGAADLLFYQLYSACGATGVDEGPN